MVAQNAKKLLTAYFHLQLGSRRDQEEESLQILRHRFHKHVGAETFRLDGDKISHQGIQFYLTT